MDGILLVDKPKGWTSFDVVAKVRSVLRTAISSQQIENSKDTPGSSSSSQVPPKRKIRVGHTGTLDPLATGLLVLVIGSYTKKVPELSKADKTYEVTMKLGETSTTGDEEGIKTRSDEQRAVSKEELLSVFEQFVGEIEQTPPAYSAVKVNGQRAYKLARAGKEVNIEPRKVRIYSLEMNEYVYPFVHFTAKVSSGTYIRSLVEDLGTKLGTGAYMSALRRTQVGEYNVKDAMSPEIITTEEISKKILTNK